MPRSTFTIGLGSEFVGTQYDCYAHIYPNRAGEIATLRETYSIQVNSAYRSPRANKFVAHSKAITTSWHMFGRAIDIEVLPETAISYKKLWKSVRCPELLESGDGILLKCDVNDNVTGLSQYFDTRGDLKDFDLSR